MSELADALRGAARQCLPPTDGEVRLPGLSKPVRVVRDRWGVPHITAESLPDVFFAQGYVTASERLFQIELSFRLGSGRLSELFGERTLAMDRFIRTIGWNRIGRRLSGEWDETSMWMHRAFLAGVRAWVETMPGPTPEHRLLGAEPWIPEGEASLHAGAAAAVFVAWSLSRAWDNDLLRAEVAESIDVETMRLLFPDEDALPAPVQAGKAGAAPPHLALLEQASFPPSGQGSNNWVISSDRSETGKPLLANDPHLAVQLPAAWIEMHLTAPGLDVAGVAFPFSPGVLIGHNRRIGWGCTNGEGDVQDLFLERLSQDGRAAEYRGSMEPLTVHREEIRIRGRDEPQVLEVRESRHGPLLDSYLIGIGQPQVVEGGIRRAYALRWVGAEVGVQPSAVLATNMAEDLETFRTSLAGWACPGQNIVYADVDGTIGYQLTGAYPVRQGHDGTLPAPGWTGEHEWTGWIPFEELPHSVDPEEGYLLTANNRPHDQSYPHLIGKDFLPPFRALRIAQLLAERERHSRESFARMQADTVSLSAVQVTPHLLRLEPQTERQKEALSLLGEWDHDLGRDSAAAALYQVWCLHIAREVLQPLLGDELYEHYYARRQWTNGFLHESLPQILAHPSARWFGAHGAAARDEALRRALDAALDELAERLGDDPSSWRWGALHRVRFAGALAPIPGCDEVYVAGEVELGGDDQTILQGLFEPGVPYRVAVLPSWRMILDVSDWDASVGTITLGQSGNPESPHFKDLLPLWSAGEHHPLPFSPSAVQAAAESTLHLAPSQPDAGA